MGKLGWTQGIRAGLGLVAWAGSVSAAALVDQVGACDASAVVFVAPGLAVVASDEDNWLRFYAPGEPVQPQEPLDLTEHLKPDGKNAEADLEGAAWLGERLYWIGSHGRNSKAKWRPNRLRLLATRTRWQGGSVTLEPDGRAASTLLDALTAHVRELELAVGAKGQDEAAALAPEAGGVNIEGLAAGADGTSLLIAFRNPLKSGKALVLPLENPAAVVDAAATPKLGAALWLDLGGLGLRSLEWSPTRGEYLIVAGSHDDAGLFALYRWSGDAHKPPKKLQDLTGLRPEGLALSADGRRAWLVSDDGDTPHVVPKSACAPEEYDQARGTCACKHLLDASRRRFRSTWIDLPN